MSKTAKPCVGDAVREALRLRRENVELRTALAAITALAAGAECKVEMLTGLYRRAN